MERASTLVLSVLCLGCLSYGLLGCDSGDRNVSSQGNTAQPAGTGAGPTPLQPPSTTSGGPMAGEPMPGGGMAGQAPPVVKPIKDATAAYDKAQKDFAAKPKDGKSKQALVDAANDLGDAYMFAKDLTPKVMYPNALKYYRVALKTDPTNAKAKGNVDLIMGIYQQMGRTPPAEGG